MARGRPPLHPQAVGWISRMLSLSPSPPDSAVWLEAGPCRRCATTCCVLSPATQLITLAQRIDHLQAATMSSAVATARRRLLPLCTQHHRAAWLHGSAHSRTLFYEWSGRQAAARTGRHSWTCKPQAAAATEAGRQAEPTHPGPQTAVALPASGRPHIGPTLQPLQFHGETGAHSAIMHALDAALGIRHTGAGGPQAGLLPPAAATAPERRQTFCVWCGNSLLWCVSCFSTRHNTPTSHAGLCSTL